MAVRQSEAGAQDPIITETRSAQQDSSYSRVNLTKTGCLTHGIHPGDELEIKVYDDRIEVRPSDDE